ncbi:MAG: TIGR01777 family oxidoreductase [Nocardioides sp.]
MRFVIAGGSGFLGSHLIAHLRSGGHEVTQLVRREPSSPDQSRWQPAEGVIDTGVVAAADVVVNLAGSPTSGNPHSEKWARELRESRVSTTRLLADTIAMTGGTTDFLAGNGISFYGDHGDEVLTEASDSRGDALLTSVTREWQAAAEPASTAGGRVCVLRTAPVMDAASPPLKQLKLLFKLGLGSKLGDGRQHFPMISLRDWVGAVTHLATDDGASGPFNLCCETTPTNAEFTEALADAVGRKAFLVAPKAVLRIAAGEMAPELLGSVNARPAALIGRGYTFADPDVRSVMAAALG